MVRGCLLCDSADRRRLTPKPQGFTLRQPALRLDRAATREWVRSCLPDIAGANFYSAGLGRMLGFDSSICWRKAFNLASVSASALSRGI